MGYESENQGKYSNKYDLRNTTDFISAVLVFYLSFMNVALLRT